MRRMSAKTFFVTGLLVAVASTAAGTSTAAKPPKKKARVCNTHKSIHLGSRTTADSGVAMRPVSAFRTPGNGAFAHFGLRNSHGAPSVFNVFEKRLGKRCGAAWYHVYLPTRPNMKTAWMKAPNIGLVAVHSHIVVDVGDHTVTLYRFGKKLLTTPAAVGKPSTPTPLGHFYVSERLVPSDPGGAFGPRALGTSAHSNVLGDWVEGGPIGIHGTNEPGSIGHAVSHGCIRVSNSVIGKIFRLSLPGTPVTIQR